MKPDAMLTTAFLAFVVAAYGACRNKGFLVAWGISAGAIYAVSSIWSFTWGQG